MQRIVEDRRHSANAAWKRRSRPQQEKSFENQSTTLSEGRERNALEASILKDIVIVITLSVGVILVCHRFRLPSIIGFLLTGILAGPHGLGIIEVIHEVVLLAEMGVILLLFVIGLELSLSELMELRRPVLGGFLQVSLTTAAAAGIASACGATPASAVFIGCLTALSSTAIVLKLYNERAEMGAPHGRMALGILIFQDVIIVPMMLLVPLLAGESDGVGAAIAGLLGRTIAIVAALILLAKYVLPRLFHGVARTQSRELFLMTVLGLCLGVALFTYKMGLSLSLGAFLAGLLISDSEYSLNAIAGILPFRDVFTSLFFISIGMLLNPAFVLAHASYVILLAVSVLLLKGAIVTLSAIMVGTPLRAAAMTGFGLAQVGEFSFVLAGVGLTHGLIEGEGYQYFLSAAILTMALTPLAMEVAPRFTSRLPIGSRSGLRALPEESVTEGGHLVVIGYGHCGRELVECALAAGHRVAVIEMNPDTVRRERESGLPIFHGDAVHPSVLEHAGAAEAALLAITVADPISARYVVMAAKELNPVLHTMVRTRFSRQAQQLKALGAWEVVVEEEELSHSFRQRALQHMCPESAAQS